MHPENERDCVQADVEHVRKKVKKDGGFKMNQGGFNMSVFLPGNDYKQVFLEWRLHLNTRGVTEAHWFVGEVVNGMRSKRYIRALCGVGINPGRLAGVHDHQCVDCLRISKSGAGGGVLSDITHGVLFPNQLIRSFDSIMESARVAQANKRGGGNE